MIVYYAEVAKNRNIAIELAEKSLKAALDEVDRAPTKLLHKAKAHIDLLDLNLRQFKQL